MGISKLPGVDFQVQTVSFREWYLLCFNFVRPFFYGWLWSGTSKQPDKKGIVLVDCWSDCLEKKHYTLYIIHTVCVYIHNIYIYIMHIYIFNMNISIIYMNIYIYNTIYIYTYDIWIYIYRYIIYVPQNITLMHCTFSLTMLFLGVCR